MSWLYFLLFTLGVSASSRIFTCYFEYDRPPVEFLPAGLCTHLNLIGSCTLDSDCHVVLPPTEHLRHIRASLQQKPSTAELKLLVTLTPRNPCMSKLTSSPNLTAEFVSEVTEFLMAESLDGFDIDWEFPVWSPDAQPHDRKGFAELIMAMRAAFDVTGRELLLTAAVAAPYDIVKKGYDIGALNRYLDYVQIMNYDFHIFSRQQPYAAFNAPLFKKRLEFGPLAKMNSDYSTQNWLRLGLWRNKTVFGIPTYGRGFTLVDRYLHYVYAPASGVSQFGAEYPFVSVCNLTSAADYEYVFDKTAKSPYLHGGEKQWLGFENVVSIFAKATYARRNDLAGIMVFDLGSDDYWGVCGKGTYPLLRAAKAALQHYPRLDFFTENLTSDKKRATSH